MCYKFISQTCTFFPQPMQFAIKKNKMYKKCLYKTYFIYTKVSASYTFNYK